MLKTFIKRVYWSYLIPAVLYNLWLLGMGWLNTYWSMLSLSENWITLNYGLFFSVLACSTAFFAWRIRNKSEAVYRKHMGLFTAVAFILSAIIPFTHGIGLILAFAGSAMGSGYMTAFLGYALMIRVPAEARGVTLGFSGGLSALLHLLIHSVLLPQITLPILFLKTFFSAVMLLLAGLAIMFLPVCLKKLYPSAEELPSGNADPGAVKPKLMLGILLVLICFYLSYGMQDFAATAYWLDGKPGLVFTRLFLVIGYFAGGLLWDFKYRYTLIISCFGLLLLGFVCMAFQYRGLASFIGFSGVQLAGSLLIVTARMIFIEIAWMYRRPVFVGLLGIVLTNLFKQAGILAAMFSYNMLGGMSIFLFSLLFVVIGLPFASVLFDRISHYRMAAIRETIPLPLPTPAMPAESEQNPMEAFKRKYGLTRREEQVLELSCRGQSIAGMASALNISEPTVKHHVRQILTKTGTKNQKQVLSLFYEGDWQREASDRDEFPAGITLPR